MPNRDRRPRIPDCDISIASRCDRALARIQPIGSRRTRGGERDELLRADTPLPHTFFVEQSQPRLESGNTGRDVPEMRRLSMRSLAVAAFEAPGTMVRRENLKCAECEARPETLGIVLAS